MVFINSILWILSHEKEPPNNTVKLPLFFRETKNSFWLWMNASIEKRFMTMIAIENRKLRLYLHGWPLWHNFVKLYETTRQSCLISFNFTIQVAKNDWSKVYSMPRISACFLSPSFCEFWAMKRKAVMNQ